MKTVDAKRCSACTKNHPQQMLELLDEEKYGGYKHYYICICNGKRVLVKFVPWFAVDTIY